jgi:ferredoxin
MKVVARRETCEGNAYCMMTAPDRFVLDEDSKVVVEEDEINSEADYDTVAKAVRECPTQSLRIEGFD